MMLNHLIVIGTVGEAVEKLGVEAVERLENTADLTIDRQRELGARRKTTNGMRGATPATSSPSEASPSGVSNNSPTDISAAEEARNNLRKKVNDLRNPRNVPDFQLLEVPLTFLQMEAARHKDFRILNVGVGSLS